MLPGAKLLPYLLSFHSSLFFASPDGNSPTNLSTLKQYKLITSTTWRNQRNAACVGLGVVLSKKATEAFEEVATGNKRILTCHWWQPSYYCIVHYASVEGSHDSEKH